MAVFGIGLVAAIAGGLAGSVGVHVEHLEGLSDEQGNALVQAIAQVSEVTSGRPTKVHLRGATPCDSKQICARDVRGRTGSTGVLFVSAYGAISKIALFLELHEEGKAPVEKRIDLDIAEQTWRPALVRALGALIPKAPKKEMAPPAVVKVEPKREDPPQPPPIARVVAPEPKPAQSSPVTVETAGPSKSKGTATTVLKWSAIGAGGVLALTGGVLLISSFARESSLNDRLEHRDENDKIDRIDYREAVEEADSIGTNRTIGVIIGLAGAAALTGGILWMTGSSGDADTVAGIAPTSDGAVFTFSTTLD